MMVLCIHSLASTRIDIVEKREKIDQQTRC